MAPDARTHPEAARTRSRAGERTRGRLLPATAGALAAVTALTLGSATPADAAKGPAPAWNSTPAPAYGYVAAGDTLEKTFTLTNNGTSSTRALKIAATTFIPTGAPREDIFVITADTCAGTALGPGKTCTTTVRFAPTSTGADYTGTLRATYDKNKSTVLNLSGTSAPPISPGCAAINANPTAASFTGLTMAQGELIQWYLSVGTAHYAVHYGSTVYEADQTAGAAVYYEIPTAAETYGFTVTDLAGENEPLATWAFACFPAP